jgi:hypothetical protein
VLPVGARAQILVLGFVMFAYPVVPQNVFGIALAVVGMAWYSEIKRVEGSVKPSAELKEVVAGPGHKGDADRK